jgi:hypothetical protein
MAATATIAQAATTGTTTEHGGSSNFAAALHVLHLRPAVSGLLNNSSKEPR